MSLTGGEQPSAFAVKGLEGILDHLDLMSFEQRFAALRTHPRWYGVPVEVIAAPVDAEWS